MARGNSFDPRSPRLGLGAVGGQVEKGMEEQRIQAGEWGEGEGKSEWPAKELSEQRLEKTMLNGGVRSGLEGMSGVEGKKEVDIPPGPAFPCPAEGEGTCTAGLTRRKLSVDGGVGFGSLLQALSPTLICTLLPGATALLCAN